MPAPGPLSSAAVDAFRVFAETLNFTRAAERLAITQPALHARIAKLGRELGVPLYRRAGRGLALTPHGRKLALFAREADGRASAFLGELRGESVDATVTLAAGEGAYLYLLGPALKRFRGAEPARLRLLTADRDGALEAVESGRAELGVAVLDPPASELVVEDLSRVEQALVIPAGHALARRRFIRLDDLRGAELVVPPPGRPHRDVIGRVLGSAGIEWRVAVEAQGWETLIHFVRLGFGLAIVNACCRLPAGVVARPVPELPAVVYRLFHRPGLAAPGAVKLRAALRAEAEAWRRERRPA